MPRLAGTKPVTASMSVVLPAPFGPIRPTTSPGFTSNDTSLTATTEPKRTVSPLIDNVAPGTGSTSAGGSGTRSSCRRGQAELLPERPGVGDDVGDAVLVQDQDDEHEDRAEDQRPIRSLRPIQSSMMRVPMPPTAFGASEDRAQHVAEAADDGVAQAVDRREDVEVVVGDDLTAEADQDAGHGREPGRHREGVQLHAEHRDAERRGGPLVGPHGDEPAAGARSTQVGDEQREEHEATRLTVAHACGWLNASTLSPNSFTTPMRVPPSSTPPR